MSIEREKEKEVGGGRVRSVLESRCYISLENMEVADTTIAVIV